MAQGTGRSTAGDKPSDDTLQMAELLCSTWSADGQREADCLASFTTSSEARRDLEGSVSAWGYMLCNKDKAYSFLLSKESRCGAKKHAGKDAREHRSSCDGVVLKDYNGDNLAASGYLIGSAEECDVVLSRAEIASHHCVLFRITSTRDDTTTSEVYVQPISDAVTTLNGRCIENCGSQILHDGDVVSLQPNGISWTFRSVAPSDRPAFRERFSVGRHLGKGHFADVFEVQNRQTNQKFAAKVIKKRLVRDHKVFLQEIGLLMSCTHPLITCIRDVFDTADHIYIILELAAGGELFDRIVSVGKFSEETTRHVFRQLFEALVYLHKHAIVHRDIKPENILLSSAQDYQIRLADFGLAKVISGESATTTLAGTPSYIPPEMLTRSADNQLRYSRKVDSWSAGVVLYICLCGFPPFSEELAPPSMRDQIRNGQFGFTRPYWDTISVEAKDLVCRMLTVDVASRISVEDALHHPFITGTDARRAVGPIELVSGPPREKRSRTLMKDLSRDMLGGHAPPGP